MTETGQIIITIVGLIFFYFLGWIHAKTDTRIDCLKDKRKKEKNDFRNKLLKIETHSAISGTVGPTEIYLVPGNINIKKIRDEFQNLPHPRYFDQVVKKYKFEIPDMIDGGTIVCGSSTEWKEM